MYRPLSCSFRDDTARPGPEFGGKMWHLRVREVGELGSGDRAGTRVGDGGPESDKDSDEAVGERALER